MFCSQPRNRRAFVLASSVYVTTLLSSVALLRWLQPAASLRWVLALLPLVGIALMARAMLDEFRASDELEQRIELTAVALATLTLTMGAFTLGLLVSADLLHVSAKAVLIWLLPTYVLLYSAARMFAVRRYR